MLLVQLPASLLSHTYSLLDARMRARFCHELADHRRGISTRTLPTSSDEEQWTLCCMQNSNLRLPCTLAAGSQDTKA